MEITPKSSIIQEATQVASLTVDEMVEVHSKITDTYVGEALQLLVALEVLKGNGYCDDEWFAAGGGDAYRIDRWIVVHLSNGWRYYTESETEQEAKDFWERTMAS